MKIIGFDESKLKISCLVKATNVLNRNINPFMKVGGYYPIVYDGLIYRMLYRINNYDNFNMEASLFAGDEIRKTFFGISKYVAFEKVDVANYNHLDGIVDIKMDYSVTLV